MGSYCSPCKISNQQVLTDNLKTNEPINSEGRKQSFKPPLIMSSRQKEELEDFPIKQYSGDAHPVISIRQHDNEEIDFNDFQIICSLNKHKKNQTLDLGFFDDELHNCQSLPCQEQFSQYSKCSMPQRKKLKRKHRNKSSECSPKVTHLINQRKNEESFFFKKYLKEFQLRNQHKLLQQIFDQHSNDSTSLISILKRSSDRKFKSISPNYRHVSFAPDYQIL